MRITEVAVEFAQLQSLGRFNHVRPSVRLTATIEGIENPELVTEYLFKRAKEAVHEEIDTALEWEGEKPRYTNRGLFVVRYDWRRKCMFVCSELIECRDGEIRHPGARHDTALAYASALATEYKVDLYDCTDGDLSKLPSRQEQPEENTGCEGASEGEPPF